MTLELISDCGNEYPSDQSDQQKETELATWASSSKTCLDAKFIAEACHQGTAIFRRVSKSAHNFARNFSAKRYRTAFTVNIIKSALRPLTWVKNFAQPVIDTLKASSALHLGRSACNVPEHDAMAKKAWFSKLTLAFHQNPENHSKNRTKKWENFWRKKKNKLKL